MNKNFLHSLTPRKALAGLALTASLAVAPGAFAQFIPTGAGPYDFSAPANWVDSMVSGTFSSNPTANQTITFGADTVLPSNGANSTLSFTNTGTFNQAFIGAGGNRTITLGGTGGINLVNSPTEVNAVTIGSAIEGEKVNVSLGSTSRTINVGTNRTLEIVNVISQDTSGRSLTKTGNGTLRLTGTANTYTGGTTIGSGANPGGILEVTKLANGGQASSIGASSNGNANLLFGGNATGTLRYIGTGDSTDRRFQMGGVGAIFDASGSGAINFSNSASPSFASAGQARTVTLTGTSIHDNNMAATFIDSVSGSTVGATSITKTGSGKWILAGVSTYTGTTTVTAGTLLVNGSISNSTTTVSGGLLGGNGTTGAVIVSDAGAIGAGNSIGTLTTGDLTLNDSAEFVFEFNIASASSVTADLINSSAFNLDTDNTAVLSLSNLGLNLALNAGTVMTLVDYSTWNGGTFAGLADDGQFTFGANTFKISYNGVSGLDSAVTLEVVPEPSTVALVGLGLASVLFRLRRRSV